MSYAIEIMTGLSPEPEGSQLNDRREYLWQRNFEDINRVLAGELTAKQFADERTERDMELENLADHDSLTGLLNRKGATDALEKEIQIYQRRTFRSDHSEGSQKPIAVLLIDGDGLKKINDERSHEEGDNAIIIIANTLNRAASRAIDYKCRPGGDEFFVILPETDLKGALKVSEEIRKGVESNQRFPGLSVSVGVTLYTGTISATQLINNADNAMYRAKEQRNFIAIHPDDIPEDTEELGNLNKFIKEHSIKVDIHHIEQPAESATPQSAPLSLT